MVCLPPVEGITKPIPIPRGEKRARLTEAGLTGKIAITSSWKAADIQKEVSCMFAPSFLLHEDEMLPYHHRGLWIRSEVHFSVCCQVILVCWLRFRNFWTLYTPHYTITWSNTHLRRSHETTYSLCAWYDFLVCCCCSCYFCRLHSIIPGGKKLTIPRTSPSFQWNAPEVASLATQGTLYIMAKMYPTTMNKRTSPVCTTKTIHSVF